MNEQKAPEVLVIGRSVAKRFNMTPEQLVEECRARGYEVQLVDDPSAGCKKAMQVLTVSARKAAQSFGEFAEASWATELGEMGRERDRKRRQVKGWKREQRRSRRRG